MNTRIHLARAGRYRDAHGRAVALDAATLKELAEAYDAAAFKAPLVLGHPADGAPAYGWIEKLTVDGDDLYGEAGEVAPDLAEAVRAGRYRNVSISYWPKGHAQSPKTAAAALRHVGVLGAQAPAIKGLTPLALAAELSDGLGDAAGVVELGSMREREGWLSLRAFARGVREWIIQSAGAEEADRVAPSWLIDDFGRAAEADEPDPRAPAFSDREPPFNDPSKETPMSGAAAQKTDEQKAVELAEREAKVAAREATLAAAEQAAAKAAEDAAKAARKTEALAFADALIAKGVLAPAGREVIADVHGRLAAAEAPLEFADGTKKPALDAFRGLFEGKAPLI